jgi:hypothetical protein
LFNLVRNWYRRKIVESNSQLKVAQFTEQFLNGNNRYYDDESEYDWIDGQNVPETKRQVSLAKARQKSRNLYNKNAHAKNIVTQITNYTVGKGFSIQLGKDQALWEKVAKIIKWKKRRRQIIRKIIVEGESLSRRFPGYQTRFVQPEQLTTHFVGNSEIENKQGVIVAKGDIEVVHGYEIDQKLVEGSEVFHFKTPDCDLDDVRGWPLLYGAEDVIRNYENWIKDRALLNRLRAAIFLVRKHKGATHSDLSNIKDSIKAGTFTKKDGSQEAYQYLRPGTAIDVNDKVDFEFMHPNVDAGDVRHDGRAMSLLIAIWFSMPEYWITGDASNASYASTAVAEAPGIKAMESWQEFFGGEVVDYVGWVLGKSDLDAVVTFPALIPRDVDKEVRALEVERRNNVVSVRTWREKRGYDPEQEDQRINDEELAESETT